MAIQELPGLVWLWCLFPLLGWPQDRYRTFSHEATEEGGIDIIDLVTMQRVLNR